MNIDQLNQNLADFESWWDKRCTDRWQRYFSGEAMPHHWDHESRIACLEGWLARAEFSVNGESPRG